METKEKKFLKKFRKTVGMLMPELVPNHKKKILLWNHRNKNLFNLIRKRPVFQKLLEKELQENDLLLVTKIDRCSRNNLDFLKLQEKLFKKSLTFIALDLPYSSDIAVNKLIETNLAAMARFENERRKEPQRQGILVSKKLVNIEDEKRLSTTN